MSRNSERESQVFKTIADHLSSGYALTTKDIREIYVLHGYKPNNSIGFTSAKGSAKFTETTGVAIRKNRVTSEKPGSKPIIYTDQALEHQDTDIAEVRASMTGEKIPDLTKKNESVTESSHPTYLTHEQLAEISALHDLAFSNGLNYSAHAVPGQMPYVTMWKRNSVINQAKD